MDFLEEHGIVATGLKRYYAQDFEFNNVSMNFKYPAYLCLDYHIFKESSWNALAVKAFNFLMRHTNTSTSTLNNFKSRHFTTITFQEGPTKGYLLLECGLYLKGNGSATFYFDLLKRMISFFNIDLRKCFLLLNVNSREEPSYIKEYIRQSRIEEFKTFLVYQKMSHERIQKVVKNLLTINRLLRDKDFRFNDVFVVTNKYNLNPIKQEVLSSFKPEYLNQIERYFGYLKEYYDQIESFADEKNIFTNFIIDGYGNVREVNFKNVDYIFEDLEV